MVSTSEICCSSNYTQQSVGARSCHRLHKFSQRRSRGTEARWLSVLAGAEMGLVAAAATRVRGYPPPNDGSSGSGGVGEGDRT